MAAQWLLLTSLGIPNVYSMDDEYEVETDSEGEEDDDSSFEDLPEEGQPAPEPEQEQNAEGENHENGGQEFDPNMIPEHSYLGHNMEAVSGRVLLDEGSIMDLPILIQPGFVGVPGQTLPLTTSHPRTISMLKNVIDGNHTFGIVSFRHDENHLLLWDKIGTSAEIYEFGDFDSDSGFRVKAKVRQRFRVIETRRQVDGNIMGTVEILPEKILSDCLQQSRPPSLTRHRIPPVLSDDLTDCRSLMQNRMYRHQSKVPYTVWPSWVYKAYDLELLSDRVRCELRKSIFVDGSSSGTVLPRSAVDLSYWVIKNLTLEDEQRIELLSINNPNQRLRAELSIMQQCEFLCCRECNHVCANQSDVFAMSRDGPQGAYVNPFGVVHETLTVYKVDGIVARTPPSTEFSWFPGYAWSICECQYCLNHMGWLFTATNRQLQPQRFWGLCRGSLKPKLKTSQGDNFVLIH